VTKDRPPRPRSVHRCLVRPGSARAILGDMLNLNLMPTLVFLFSFLFLYFAVRLGVHHGMRDFTRREAAQRR